ncbi:hypothetical protein RhiirA5_421010 [Rhizophagus irregularis]|uniref:Uncharacterized protein n=1 Tax=Rhizophagus irregularis TaxID=588596 RepID=A0A2I1EFR0_9GLOM|nr:hypothetical protein RhiirA5_421010 [Rhizophagus irregularis]PKC60587.1 hypothetical protein RhiirA1_467826 [Rhizophagus irregularis]PKY20947.1 hypothetical protein RhiirB3_434403 [Rhizophagus irregularis]CAB4477976.1 unnamed protein product [Rhizophagus irregularis]CAB5392841.1 unnamed protein product [Rhizophagus irregularis]
MSKNILLFRLFVFLNCVFQIFGQISYVLPEGWFFDGGTPQNYGAGVDYATFYEKAPSGFLKSHPNISSLNSNSHGFLVQRFIPSEYLGKQVRLTCFIKYSDVSSSSSMGLYLKVFSVNGGFDNTFNKNAIINGAGDWKKFESVVNVPEDTVLIDFGALLNGEGVVWLDKCNFEIVEPPDELVSFPVPKSEPNENNFGYLTYPIHLDFSPDSF